MLSKQGGKDCPGTFPGIFSVKIFADFFACVFCFGVGLSADGLTVGCQGGYTPPTPLNPNCSHGRPPLGSLGQALPPAPLISATIWSFIAIFLITALCVSGCAKINRMQHLKSIEIRAARQQRVQEAYQKASKVIARRAAEFSNFIHSRKSGAKSFSQDLVSPYGRWRAVSPYLPLRDKEGHRKYIEGKFEQHILTKQALAAALKETIKRSVKDVESIENELATILEREIFGQALSPNGAPIAAKEFKELVERMGAASQRDVAKYPAELVITEVITEVAERVVKKVLVRLGVSGAILTAGTVNSWWSLGATVLIGIVVDQVWEWIDDPAEGMEREVSDALDSLSQDAAMIIEEEMHRTLSQRREFWDRAAAKLLSNWY